MANMMTVHCDIVSAEGEIFSGQVEMVIAHGSLGDLGIALGHAPLITELKPGPIRLIKLGGEAEVFYISCLYFDKGGDIFSPRDNIYLITEGHVVLLNDFVAILFKIPYRLSLTKVTDYSFRRK